jgi:hypothetical protein
MMRARIIILGLSIIVALLGAGCASGVPDSSLTVRDAHNNLLLATSQTQGILQLEVGEIRQIKVLRTFQNDNSQTITDDVTQFANIKWEANQGAATFDQLGNISGVNQGLAILEVKFRSSNLERWDTARLTVQVVFPPD